MRKYIRRAAAVVTAVSCLALSGCGSDAQKETTAENVSLSEIHDAVAEAYGDDYIPSYTFDEEYLEDVFGLTADLYDDVYAEGPKVAFDVDTFIAVKAKEGKSEEVKKILENYRENLISTAYPDTLIKTQASVVTEYGNYIFFTCLGVISDEAKASGDNAVLEEAKSDNKVATDVIKGFFE